MLRTLMARAGAVLAVVAAALLFWAVPASAHVTVNPREATQGGFTKVAFRVPNEKDSAATVKLEVFLPPDQPIASVSVKPTPGWTVVAEKSKLTTPIKSHDREITEAVTKITWTAGLGSEIRPGQFQEFEVSMGPLPETDQLVFKALQTYSDKDVVRWIDEPVAGGEEPEHPAPVLKLNKAATNQQAALQPVAAETATDSGDSGSSAGIVLGVVGIALGLAGLAIGLLAYRRTATAS